MATSIDICLMSEYLLTRFLGFVVVVVVYLLLARRNLSAAAAKSLQSYPTLCDPTDSSPPDPSVHGIL